MEKKKINDDTLLQLILDGNSPAEAGRRPERSGIQPKRKGNGGRRNLWDWQTGYPAHLPT